MGIYILDTLPLVEFCLSMAGDEEQSSVLFIFISSICSLVTLFIYYEFNGDLFANSTACESFVRFLVLWNPVDGGSQLSVKD